MVAGLVISARMADFGVRGVGGLVSEMRWPTRAPGRVATGLCLRQEYTADPELRYFSARNLQIRPITPSFYNVDHVYIVDQREREESLPESRDALDVSLIV